jgi:hypothetical protein
VSRRLAGACLLETPACPSRTVEASNANALGVRWPTCIFFRWDVGVHLVMGAQQILGFCPVTSRGVWIRLEAEKEPASGRRPAGGAVGQAVGQAGTAVPTGKAAPQRRLCLMSR